jgi:uncharacterized protein (TIGR02001 family)
MAESRKVVNLLGAAGVALLALTGGALADGSIKDAPADEGRKFTYSFNITGTSDYVFRGVSQTDNDPTIQGAINLGYGIFYAGVWASGLDWDPGLVYDGELEMDWYGGIKPTWGALTFDFGVIYYSYPGNGLLAGLTDADYLEFKAGVSGSPFENATLGATAYYSDDYFGETGAVWTVEGTAGYTFKPIGIFTPTISGLIGYQDSEDAAYAGFNGFDSYYYWNAGLSLAVEKITLDFRYWDTADASNALSTTPTYTCQNSYCDERFVFSVGITLP